MPCTLWKTNEFTELCKFDFSYPRDFLTKPCNEGAHWPSPLRSAACGLLFLFTLQSKIKADILSFLKDKERKQFFIFLCIFRHLLWSRYNNLGRFISIINTHKQEPCALSVFKKLQSKHWISTPNKLQHPQSTKTPLLSKKKVKAKPIYPTKYLTGNFS